MAEKVVGFKKIKMGTLENVGSGEVELPQQEMQTTSVWLTVPPASSIRVSPLARGADRRPARAHLSAPPPGAASSCCATSATSASWLGDGTPAEAGAVATRESAEQRLMQAEHFTPDHLSLRLARPGASAWPSGIFEILPDLLAPRPGDAEGVRLCGRVSLVRRSGERGRPPRQDHRRSTPHRAHRLRRMPSLDRASPGHPSHRRRTGPRGRPPTPVEQVVDGELLRHGPGHDLRRPPRLRARSPRMAPSRSAMPPRRRSRCSRARRAIDAELGRRRAPALPRHRDHRAGRRHRHLRVPGRRGLLRRRRASRCAQFFMRDLDEEPALLAALGSAARALRRLRHLQRRRLRPAAARDALRARPPPLAGRRLSPGPASRRAPAVDATGSPTAGWATIEQRRARLRPRRRPAGRADSRRSTSTICGASGRDTPARVRAQPPRHPVARRADRLGRGAVARAPGRRRRVRRSLAGSAACWEPRDAERGARLLPEGAGAGPAEPGRASGCWLRLAHREKRGARWDEARALWETAASATPSILGRGRRWPRSTSIAPRSVGGAGHRRRALDQARSIGAAPRVLDGFAYRLARIERRLNRPGLDPATT